jgi:NAD(P)-dependent dehydrogenase (short-subunit alcohol dehydrogenase family)
MLDGRVIMVTGAASGIGAATARLAAAEGASLALIDLDADGIASLAGEIGVGGERPSTAVADLTTMEGAQIAVGAALERFGRLDGAVNSAGILGRTARIESHTFEEWRRILTVDLDGLFLCVQAEVRAMLESGGGSIVNVSSGAGLVGAPASSAYAAAKHGVIGLTRSVTGEHARDGIRVNAVCPAMIETPMLDDLFENSLGHSPGSRSRAESRQPMGRFGRAEEVAEANVWLLSERASYVNGVALPVDGGQLALP